MSRWDPVLYAKSGLFQKSPAANSIILVHAVHFGSTSFVRPNLLSQGLTGLYISWDSYKPNFSMFCAVRHCFENLYCYPHSEGNCLKTQNGSGILEGLGPVRVLELGLLVTTLFCTF